MKGKTMKLGNKQKSLYVQPFAEVVRLNVSSDILEGDFLINSRPGVETLSKRADLFQDPDDMVWPDNGPTVWDD